MTKKKKQEAPKTYTLGKHTFTLSPPASMAQRFSIVTAASTNQLYAVSAALGACWRGAGRPTSRIGSFSHDFHKYGQAVFDELCGRGLSVDEIADAAGDAFMLCVRGLPNAEAIDQTANFIEAEPEQ